MRAKKLLALALAGMALTTCLSGCDRTIIEHQFHTDTVTGSGNATTVENDTLLVLKKMENLFEERGDLMDIYIDLSYTPTPNNPEYMKPHGDVNSTESVKEKIDGVIDQMAKLEDSLWVAAPIDFIYTEYDYEKDGVYGYTNAWLKSLNTIYDVFQNMSDTEWEKLEQIAENFGEYRVMLTLLGYIVADEDSSYVETVVAFRVLNV